MIRVPSERGKGQTFARCRQCQIALWSHYAGMGRRISFIRAGTLDDPSQCPPDIHIYTSTKQDHVILPKGVPQRGGYYDKYDYWPAKSLTRFNLDRSGS